MKILKIIKTVSSKGLFILLPTLMFLGWCTNNGEKQEIAINLDKAVVTYDGWDRYKVYLADDDMSAKVDIYIPRNLNLKPFLKLDWDVLDTGIRLMSYKIVTEDKEIADHVDLAKSLALCNLNITETGDNEIILIKENRIDKCIIKLNKDKEIPFTNNK